MKEVTTSHGSRRLRDNLKGRCLYLMVALLALLLLHPYFPSGLVGQTLLLVLNSATLIAGVYAVSDTRRHMVIAIAIGIPWFVLAWSSLILGGAVVALSSLIVTIVFYTFALVRVLAYVLLPSPVTRDKIHGAISVYLLMGLTWASCYSLIHVLQPGAFLVDEAHNPDGAFQFADFVYFSFVTLTTLGYGEITPVSAQARSLAMMEAVSGVLYIAVLVARLVGLYRPEDR